MHENNRENYNNLRKSTHVSMLILFNYYKVLLNYFYYYTLFFSYDLSDNNISHSIDIYIYNSMPSY